MKRLTFKMAVFTENLQKFNYKNRKSVSLKKEVYHTISNYKQYVDSYRKDVNALGIYEDNEFNSIFLYNLNDFEKILFVVTKRGNDLLIKCGYVKHIAGPELYAEVFTLPYDSFKLAINNFNKEVSNMHFDNKKPFSLNKLSNIFIKHFSSVSNIENIETISFDSAMEIFSSTLSKELKDFDKLYTKTMNKKNKVFNIEQEVRIKVREYEKKLLDKAKYSYHKNSCDILNVKLNKERLTLQDKIKEIYSYKKSFIYSFDFNEVKKKFKSIFNDLTCSEPPRPKGRGGSFH